MDGIFFSIIIPTFQRPDLVAGCLSRLFVQETTVAVEHEIIVGDDSRDEDTKKCLEENFPSVRWVRSPGKGPAANRNHAAEYAKGEWLIFIDDDTEPYPGFLQAYFELAKTGQYKVLEGKIICPDKRNSPFYRMPENLTGNIFPSGNIAFQREVFDQLGGFDEELVVMEDMEIAHRIRKKGIAHTFCPEAAVDHRAQRIGWKYMLWWASHHRWSILFKYKIDRKRLETPMFLAALQSCFSHVLLLSRTSSHLISQHDPASWKNRWFWQAWGWLSLPYTLVCLVVSEYLFRKIVRKNI